MRWTTSVLLASLAATRVFAQDSRLPINPAVDQFDRLCAECHGRGGAGGDRAPALVDNRELRTQSEQQVADLIAGGTPGGMPPFRLPPSDLHRLAAWIRAQNASAFEAKPEGDRAAGEALFFG